VRGVKEDWCGNGDSIMESTMDSVRDKLMTSPREAVLEESKWRE
jgi:hypothetical protein